jgi:hypothetical protein
MPPLGYRIVPGHGLRIEVEQPNGARALIVGTLDSIPIAAGGEALHLVICNATVTALPANGCVNQKWIWPTFRDRLDPCPGEAGGQLARRTRLRSSSNPARPYICRLIILMRFTDPSTAPELCSRVRPLSTAS